MLYCFRVPTPVSLGYKDFTPACETKPVALVLGERASVHVVGVGVVSDFYIVNKYIIMHFAFCDVNIFKSRNPPVPVHILM